MKRHLGLAFGLCCVLAGCHQPMIQPYAIRPGDLQPVQASIPPEQRTAVWQHAINVLLDEGFVPQVIDEASGYISAKHRDDEQGNLNGTMAIVTITTEGKVRVEVSGFGDFASQGEIESVVDQVQSRLLAEIVGQPTPVAAVPPAT